MFAGKTSEIQSVVRRYSCLGRRVLVLTADIDNRYQSEVAAIVNHNLDSMPAKSVAVDALMSVLELEEFRDASAVVVDEAQFFCSNTLVPFVRAAVDQYRKHVVVVGLDGDVNRNPFGDVLALIPMADAVEKLTALCRRCGDGTPALFTRAIGSHEQQVVVGGADKYEPVCRKHYLG